MLKNTSKVTLGFIYLSLAVMLLLSVIVSVNIGAVKVSPQVIFQVIADHIVSNPIFEECYSSATSSIIWNLRLPRILVAGCVGGGLALSGIFMQALTKNSLADPYILGISSGASTGAVLSILVGTLPLVGKLPLSVGAFCGALLTTILVFLIGGAGRECGTTKLVLTGMAVSALFSSLTNLIIFLTPDSKKVTSALFWMTGSFSGVVWSDVLPAFVTLAVGAVIAFIMNRELDALLMGEENAKNYGVNTNVVKTVLLIVSTLLTAVMVSMSGIIGFAGLVIPHVSRSITGAAHKRMIPLTVLLGGIFLIWADVIARVCAAPEELPVGVITAIAGAPFFLAMLRKSSYSFGK